MKQKHCSFKTEPSEGEKKKVLRNEKCDNRNKLNKSVGETLLRKSPRK